MRRIRRYCSELGLSEGVDIHSLRRSYATHLLEAGWNPRFVQDQMGHEYASTTGIYQFTSDEFCRPILRAALDRTVGEALGRRSEDGAS
ncbi:tyrosine-type recombinase/integrase [Kribbella sp. NBC_00359]|uniref:tyrosine-type recombinase/integrase n=1 Tax=Kribbella sp. NBC_00359 TaxID=2975966 RepID=UPI003FA56ACE